MKYLIIIVAVTSCHCGWGAFLDSALTRQIEIGGTCSQDIQRNNPSLGVSLNSTEGGGSDDESERDLPSPPARRKSSSIPTDQGDSPASTSVFSSQASGLSNSLSYSDSPLIIGGEPICDLKIASHEGNGSDDESDRLNHLPVVRGGSSEVSKSHNDSTTSTCVFRSQESAIFNSAIASESPCDLNIASPVSYFSISQRINPSYTKHFSRTTYELLVCGFVRKGSLIFPVQSIGKKTPCLDYFQRIPFSSRDVVESLHLDLLVNLPAAAEDFEIDCNNLNLRLGLTFEQASDLLKTIQGELLAILEDDSIF